MADYSIRVGYLGLLLTGFLHLYFNVIGDGKEGVRLMHPTAIWRIAGVPVSMAPRVCNNYWWHYTW